MSRSTPEDDRSPDVQDDSRTTGTSTDADTTRRMSTTHGTDHCDSDHGDSTDHGDSDTDHGDSDHRDSTGHRERPVETVRPTDRPHGVRPAKTSAAAAFGLVFGLTALICALTAILAPAAVLFGLIGIIVAAAGLKMTKRPGVTGRAVAMSGLVTAVLGLLLGVAVLIGAAVLVNDEQRLDQLEDLLTELRNDLPSTTEISDQIPG